MKKTLYSLGFVVGSTETTRNEDDYYEALRDILLGLAVDSSNHYFVVGFANAQQISIEEAKEKIMSLDLVTI